MKKTRESESRAVSDELRAEYDFDYRKARPNRFAASDGGKQVVVALDPDVSQVFTTSDSVNTVLRALIAAMPKSSKQTKARR
jgi:hypothetical protein